MERSKSIRILSIKSYYYSPSIDIRKSWLTSSYLKSKGQLFEVASATIVTQIVMAVRLWETRKILYLTVDYVLVTRKIHYHTILIEIANKDHVVPYSKLILWFVLCKSTIQNFTRRRLS